MKAKRLFFPIILFLSAFYNVFASDYEVLKQEDKYEFWLERSFEQVLIFDENAQYDLAEQLCDSVLARLWREPNNKPEYDALFNISLYKAIYLQDNGNIPEASSYFELALKHYELSNQTNKSILYFIYPKLGNNYTRLGDNENAILVFQKMGSFAKEEKNYEALVQSLINFSIACKNKGDIKCAWSVLYEAEDYVNSISDYRKAILYSLRASYIADFNARDPNGVKYNEKAKSLFLSPKVDADSYFLGGIYRTSALLNSKNGNLNQAKEDLLKSIDYYKKSKQNKHREIAKIYIELIKIAKQNEKLFYINKSLSYVTNKNDLKTLENKDLYAENTFVELLSEAIEIETDDDAKLKYYDYIFEVQKLLRKEYIYDDSKLNLLKENNNRIEEALEVCSDKFDETNDDKYVFKALEYVENSKSILLFESLLKEVNLASKKNYQQFILKKKQIINKIVIAKQSLNDSAIIDLEHELKDLVFQFQINNSELKNALKSNDIEIFSSTKFQKDFLKENECLLSYFIGEKNLYVIHLNQIKSSLSKTFNNEDLKYDIQGFSNLFNFENRFNFNRKLASDLGNKLIGNIDSKTDKIIIITDGFLNNIPFEALIKDDEYLIENYEIQYAFSANLLGNLNFETVNNNEVIAFAPIFENKASKFLKNSEAELKNISKELKVQQLFNEEATTSNFLNSAKDFSIIHISTHAKIDEGLNTASIDFYDKTLFYSQIKDEKFNADLLVLSACETGIGQQKIGEGSMSVTRAFAYSNIDAFVSSLWKVNEESSLYIFKDFYKNISKKQSVSEALRNSKLSYLYNPKIAEEKKMPYYWAPYIFIGKDKMLNVNTNSSYLLFLILGIILVGLIIFIWKYKK